MSVTLCVARLLDPEMEEDHLEIEEQLLGEINRELFARGLPQYRDPDSGDINEPYWNATYANSCQGYLHSQIASLQADHSIGIQFHHFVDAKEAAIRYIPIDFPEPIHMTVADKEGLETEVFFGSCQRLLREIEQLAGLLEIPLERFPIDFSGDSKDEGGTWNAVFDELKKNNAPCMSMKWRAMTEEDANASLEKFCEMTGIPIEEFRKSLVEEHGSLAAFAQEDNLTDEEKNAMSLYALINHWHGCRLAIERGLIFDIG